MKQAYILHYRDQGHGPVVVLLHGFLASSLYWQRVADRLARKHRVITIDLLGFGNSPKPVNSRYDYSAQLNSINATLGLLGITKKFTLMGHSMGSLIALRYASQNQRRVKKLVLANMPVFLNYKEARQAIQGTNFVYKIGLIPVMHDIVWPLFKATTYLRLLPLRISEGAANRRSYLFQNTGFSRLRSLRNVIYSATIEADLLRLDIATTIVSGVQDRQEYLINLPKLRQAANIVSQTVAGGHHLPLSNPELLATLA